MLINITGGTPETYWKRATLLSTATQMDNTAMSNCFREPLHYMFAAFADYQLGWPTPVGEAGARVRRDIKIDELPGQPSPAHMVETLYSEWGHQCLGRNFWIETWKYRSRWALSQGCYVIVCDADSDAEKQAVLDICEHPIVIDAGDQRFKEGLSYLEPENPTRPADVVNSIDSAQRLLSAELQDLFAEHSLKLA